MLTLKKLVNAYPMLRRQESVDLQQRFWRNLNQVSRRVMLLAGNQWMLILLIISECRCRMMILVISLQTICWTVSFSDRFTETSQAYSNYFQKIIYWTKGIVTSGLRGLFKTVAVPNDFFKLIRL